MSRNLRPAPPARVTLAERVRAMAASASSRGPACSHFWTATTLGCALQVPGCTTMPPSASGGSDASESDATIGGAVDADSGAGTEAGLEGGSGDAAPTDQTAPDTVGPRLQGSLIRSPSPDTAVVFRQSFDVQTPITTATAHIFADARYSLWINGQYVSTGPNRFDPKGPQFDSIDVTTALHMGPNTVNFSTQHHAEPFAAHADRPLRSASRMARGLG
jgi:hypothetical protein